jgi:hypothetical protein
MTEIRKRAPVSSWVAGYGGKDFGHGKLIYLMQVKEVLTFEQYFGDRRFMDRLDNVYHKVNGVYQQVPSARAHTKDKEKKHDLSEDRVLIASRFVYFGTNKIDLGKLFSDFVPSARSYRNVDGAQIDGFVSWAFSHGSSIAGTPHKPLLPPSTTLVQLG